jgi:hypothetical protein
MSPYWLLQWTYNASFLWSVLQVAEFHKLWMYDNKARRVSFWRPILPPGYVNLGDCMSFSVHPPKLVTVFLDDSQGHMSSE